jgi:type IV secretory pathway TrbL component
MIQDFNYAVDLYAVVIMTLAILSILVAFFTKVAQLTIKVGFWLAIILPLIMLSFGFILLMF